MELLPSSGSRLSSIANPSHLLSFGSITVRIQFFAFPNVLIHPGVVALVFFESFVRQWIFVAPNH